MRCRKTVGFDARDMGLCRNTYIFANDEGTGSRVELMDVRGEREKNGVYLLVINLFLWMSFSQREIYVIFITPPVDASF